MHPECCSVNNNFFCQDPIPPMFNSTPPTVKKMVLEEDWRSVTIKLCMFWIKTFCTCRRVVAASFQRDGFAVGVSLREETVRQGKNRSSGPPPPQDHIRTLMAHKTPRRPGETHARHLHP